MKNQVRFLVTLSLAGIAFAMLAKADDTPSTTNTVPTELMGNVKPLEVPVTPQIAASVKEAMDDWNKIMQDPAVITKRAVAEFALKQAAKDCEQRGMVLKDQSGQMCVAKPEEKKEEKGK